MAAKKKPTRAPRAAKPTKKGLSFAAVCRLAKALPGVVESTSYGTLALKVEKAMFAHLKEDGDTIVIRMDMVSRDLLVRAQPAIFFLTDHYRDYPYVLVRLSEVTTKQMAELLEDAWRLAASRRLIAAYDRAHLSPRVP